MSTSACGTVTMVSCRVDKFFILPAWLGANPCDRYPGWIGLCAEDERACVWKWLCMCQL